MLCMVMLIEEQTQILLFFGAWIIEILHVDPGGERQRRHTPCASQLTQRILRTCVCVFGLIVDEKKTFKNGEDDH